MTEPTPSEKRSALLRAIRANKEKQTAPAKRKRPGGIDRDALWKNAVKGRHAEADTAPVTASQAAQSAAANPTAQTMTAGRKAALWRDAVKRLDDAASG